MVAHGRPNKRQSLCAPPNTRRFTSLCDGDTRAAPSPPPSLLFCSLKMRRSIKIMKRTCEVAGEAGASTYTPQSEKHLGGSRSMRFLCYRWLTRWAGTKVSWLNARDLITLEQLWQLCWERRWEDKRTGCVCVCVKSVCVWGGDFKVRVDSEQRSYANSFTWKFPG